MPVVCRQFANNGIWYSAACLRLAATEIELLNRVKIISLPFHKISVPKVNVKIILTLWKSHVDASFAFLPE